MILITGASGMIGRAITELLLAQGQELRVQVRNRQRFRDQMKFDTSKIDLQEADFERISERSMQHLVAGCSAVIHAAGLVHDPDAQFTQYELLNIRTTQMLAECAKQAEVNTFIFFSSIAVYGDGPFENITEDSVVKPTTPYAVSKHKSEQWLASANLFKRTIVLRPPLVFGEGDRGQLLKLIRQINHGAYFNIGPKPAFKSMIYSRDLAKIVSLCFDKVADGYHVFNSCNPEPISVWDLGEEISRCLNKSTKLQVLPGSLVRLGAQVAGMVMSKPPLTPEQINKLTSNTTCSAQKLVSTLGFAPAFTLQQALTNEISWARESQLVGVIE